MFTRSRIRQTIGVALGVLVLFPVINDFFLSRPLPINQLHQIWESHMFKGTFGIYSNGRRTVYQAENSYQWANGSPLLAWLTKEGIAVSDRRETSMLGWLRTGGWVLEGGLLAKLENQESNLELHGKRVFRANPVFFLNLHSDNTREHSIEFFLVRRNKQDSKARLLKKWTFSAEEMFLDKTQPENIKGFLRNYIPRQTVTLVVTGLNRPFEDSVDISMGN